MSADTALRGNVRLLGNLLGRVLVEQEGERLLELEERIRSLARAGRQGDAAASAELTETVRGAAARRAGDRAARVRRSTSSSRTSPSSTTGSAAGAPPSARAACSASRWPRRSRGSATPGSPRTSCSEAAARVSVELVLTAHPTEATRRTILASHQRVAGAPARRSTTRSWRPSSRAEVEDALAEEITILWQTDEVRSRRPRVVDEIRQGLWFVERGLWEAAPRLLAAWRVRLPGSPLRFGTWIGGDLDGNPSVGPDTVEEAVERAHALALTLYRREVRELAVAWGMAAGVAGADPAVGDVPGLDPEQNADEPYRRRLTAIWERLGADGYASAAELAAELELVDASLRAHGGARIADGGLAALRRRLDIFGLHLATLELRVHARRCGEPDERLARDPRGGRAAPGAARPRGARHADRLDDALGRRRRGGRGARGARPGSRCASCRCSRRSTTCAAPARSSRSCSTGARARRSR